jgi:hypothetical protein
MSLTTARLADAASVSEMTVKRALAGQPLAEATVELLAAALETTMRWLYGDDSGEEQEELIKVYQRRVIDLKITCERTRRNLRIAVIVALSLMAFICLTMAMDILVPTIGWVRR